MKPTILCIMDGWGIGPHTKYNAVTQAKTPVFDRLIKRWPNSLMQASGRYVGLPEGQMGNSEVGHMNIGAGRIIVQDLPKINQVIQSKKLTENKILKKFISATKKAKGKCHLVGLLSTGGVHSHQTHIEALAKIISKAGVPVLLHGILDGRDTAPRSALTFVKRFLAIKDSNISLASLIGRFYAMDRDNRWERVQKSYGALVNADGEKLNDLRVGIKKQYELGITDEFIEPLITDTFNGINDGDSLFFANFRADRARELLSAVVDPAFKSFPRASFPNFSAKAGLVSYSDHLDSFLDTLFPKQHLNQTLGETVAKQKITQLRIAETEKYPHVTFFLNGGQEVRFPGEERILVPSPKVLTYDTQPEMSAKIVTQELTNAIAKNEFGFIVVNYANPDMVGHTGNLKATIKAVETVDQCVGKVVESILDHNGTMLLTADHGNCEVMFDERRGIPHTAHTTNLVPTVLINAPSNVAHLKPGKLADVAPTILDLMSIPKPKIMTGSSLLPVNRVV